MAAPPASTPLNAASGASIQLSSACKPFWKTSRMEHERVEFKYLTLISGLFVGCLLISNTVAQKPIKLGPFVEPADIILFPLTYIFGDVLTEVYGYARTRQVIWTGFIASGLMAAVYWIVIAMPGADFWTQQDAVRSVLFPVPRIVLASLAGYLAGEFVNSFVLAKMKLLTQGQYLWTRTIGSTIAGQAVDTTLFVTVAFAGIWPRAQLASAIYSLYALKVAYEVIATPLTYSAVAFLKRTEGSDHYDRQTDFIPFRWKL